MRTITTLLFCIVLLSLSACEKKKKNEQPQLELNNTEIVTQKDLKKDGASKDITDINHSKYTDTFTLEDEQKKSYTFAISTNNIYSQAFDNKTILINISDLSSHSSLDQMESLSKLQKRYQNDIIVITILSGNRKTLSKPHIFLNKHHIYHFVSFSKENESISKLLYASLDIQKETTPFTIIYAKNKYYNHFEGITPLEMIEHDIKQTIKK